MFHHLHIHHATHNKHSKKSYWNHIQFVIIKNMERISVIKFPCCSCFPFIGFLLMQRNVPTINTPSHVLHPSNVPKLFIILHNRSPFGVWIYLGNILRASALIIIFVYLLMVDIFTLKQSAMFSQECPWTNLSIMTFNLIIVSCGGLTHQLAMQVNIMEGINSNNKLTLKIYISHLKKN